MDDQQRAALIREAMATGAQRIQSTLGAHVVRGYSAALLSNRTDLQHELELQVIGSQPRTVAVMLGADAQDNGGVELTLMANPDGAQNAARLILMTAALNDLRSRDPLSGTSVKAEMIEEQVHKLFRTLLTGEGQVFTYLDTESLERNKAELEN